ncbi:MULTISPECIES: radical SAM family heme chaperone HemW [unclassified Facklamia]|uniref:radical SAM family heme chaperone HemW n=1 Tax=Aerococcaceae TaxID=186827 RepID=UPI0013B728D4|nr:MULTISPECIES: radical SAM family heme chaperone HemW [unclassified Facklamia]MBS4461105.1 oxygen-independent coproporphyrinogen III oxidase [Aerococcaceae bacterium zg-B36]NEW64406.1 oxygen-independent coproporphyrinogen III oxidase [Facklamia sp. 252]NEW68487.1 oxygen-independent coproporphyrinogen III oxidase [Facklamia sp. 253]QQD64866.1 oxygen-independent coproporphyrinogen III oxidase [Aerococcaceae bacterium zg-252]
MESVKAAYIHIPFCKKICHYCAFNKYFYDGQPVGRYLTGLEQEFSLYLNGRQERFDTIYVGGGTPSCLNIEELTQLLTSIQRYLPYDEQTEYTFEINPGELTFEKCQLLAQFGVNRVSMGVQSFNDRLLRKIGRNHREKHIYQCIEWLREAGITNLSIDLIFRLPEQTMEDFDESLTKALSLDLPHYSLYSLIIENQTLFQQLQRQGKLPLPSEDVDADMFELAIRRLHEAGIEQYEVSNFARPGFESRHNLKYWQYVPYYGFGAGAHGFVDGVRYYNSGPVHHYLRATEANQKPLVNETSLSLEDQMEEYLFLALRTTKGFYLSDFEQRFKKDANQLFGAFFAEQAAAGLLICENDNVRLTTRGLFLADTVFRDLLGTITMG